MSPVVSPEPVAGAPAHAVPAGAPCLGCRQPLTGPYCAQCGQPASTRARITLADLLHDIPHSVWHVDHGVFYTLRELLLRPGQTLRRYLSGERARFFRPLALLLLVSGAVAFLMFALHVKLLDGGTPPANATAEARKVAVQMAEVNQLIFKYFSWFTITMLPVYAALSRALLGRLRLHYAEHLLLNGFLLAAAAFLQLCCVPLLAATSGAWFRGIYFFETALLPLYQIWSFSQLAAPAYGPAGRVLRAVSIAGLGLVLNSLLITGIALLIVSLRH